MTRAEEIQVERTTRIRTSLGAILTLVGVAAGAAFATMGFKSTTESSLETHAKVIEDHEKRIREAENTLASSIAEIKADLRTIKERIK